MSKRLHDAAPWLALLAAVLACLWIGPADAAEYDGPHHFNVVFHIETTLQEVAWQALNVVDTAQTLYIADHPARYQEIGQAGMICGTHPSRGQVYFTMGLFAVAHYAVSFGLENLTQQNPDYEVLQRVWQYSTLGYKVYVVGENHRIGIPY